MEEDQGRGKGNRLGRGGSVKVAIDPKSSRMVVGGKNGKLSVYSLDDGKLLSEGNSTNLIPGHRACLLGRRNPAFGRGPGKQGDRGLAGSTG